MFFINNGELTEYKFQIQGYNEGLRKIRILAKADIKTIATVKIESEKIKNESDLKNRFFLFFAFLFLSIMTKAQEDSLRQRIVEEFSKDLCKHYLSAKIAKQMGDTIKNKFKQGGYDNARNIDEFFFEITKDIRRVSNDKHLEITSPQAAYFDPDLYQKELDKLSEKQRRSKFKDIEKKYKEMRSGLLEDDYSYGDVKILPGNIGYLQIKLFDDEATLKKNKPVKIAKVAEFLKNTSSIIVDLRDNSGGSIWQAVRFASYFTDSIGRYFLTTQTFIRYDSDGIQRDTIITKRKYSDPKIDNTLLADKTLLILVSSRTFSAAETAVYLLKKLRPDTKIIGERTMGGGNIYGDLDAGEYYSAVIPTGKCIDEERNNYSFEGKGIDPDIEVQSDSAYEIAYRRVIANSNVSKEGTKYLIKQKTMKSEVELKLDFSEYIGDYSKIQVFQNAGRLFVNYDNHYQEELFAKSKDLFKSENLISAQFFRDTLNNIMGIKIQRSKGFYETFFKKP